MWEPQQLLRSPPATTEVADSPLLVLHRCQLFHPRESVYRLTKKFEGSVIWILILRICWHLLHLMVSIMHAISHVIEVGACYFSSSGIFLKKYHALPLSKLQYLAIVVDSEEAKQILHIGNLMRWLSDIGIKHVTFYDIEGVLKDLGAKLNKLAKCNSTLTDSAGTDKMLIESLSLSDGRQGIANAANLLFSKFLNDGNIRGEKAEPIFTEADINNALREVGCGTPDPDLLLVFGPARCHLGFPPWRLRYTEIVHMGPLRSASYNAIIRAFYEFSTKRQNYGS